MKVTVVPAQVTTVEDRIIGNLGLSQILLLVVPVFLSAGIFALMPPFMALATYKYVIMVALTLIFALLAVRIKGTIVAVWLATILRYNLRPQYYLFNKNISIYRENYPVRKAPQAIPAESTSRTRPTHAGYRIDPAVAVKLLATLDNPAAHVRFETNNKGGMYVRFTEIED